MHPLYRILLILLTLAGAVVQAQVTVRVDAMCNIYGAGIGTPPAPGGGGGGILPVEIAIPLNTKMVVFTSTSGQVSCCSGDPGTFNGADGALSGSTVLNPFGSISGIVHDYNTMFLCGVFLGPDLPQFSPPGLVFTDFTDFTSLSTELGQTFFIGDGLTGNGQGELQKFMVPSGATRLFLGFADALGSAQEAGHFDDNAGELNTRVVPVEFLDISAQVDSCNGYADIAVESGDLTGATKAYKWRLNGIAILDADAAAIRAKESGEYNVSVEWQFGGVGPPVTCDTSIYVEAPLSDLDISIITEPANCGFEDGLLQLNVEGSSAEILTSVDGMPFTPQLSYPMLPAGTYNIAVDIEGICLFDTAVVIDQNRCPLYIPNIFSPNDDGVNDLFGISVNDTFHGEVRLFTIYDRWGTLIYRQQNGTASDLVWDGSFNGLKVNSGVYVYNILLEDEKGNQEHISGNVTLLR